MYEIFDEFCWTKQKKTIIKDKHQVPALGNFSHWNYTTSSTPSPMHYHSDIIEIHCLTKGTRYTYIEKDESPISITDLAFSLGFSSSTTIFRRPKEKLQSRMCDWSFLSIKSS